MLLGAHESAAGGPYRAIRRAEEDGCASVQLFVKNNNRWKQRPWTDDEIEAFRDAWRASSLDGLMAHTSYLINLCSTSDTTVARSIDGLADELTRCARLGIPLLVLHPGSHLGEGEDQGIRAVARRLDELWSEDRAETWRGHVRLLFENTAGQGTNLGYSLEHLRDLLGALDTPLEHFGICLDTCHAHAAGYELRSPQAYQTFWSSFDETVGRQHLAAFHLNDSRADFASRVDRHELLGEGTLGLDAIARFVRDPRFKQLPGVLETPALPSGETDYARQLTLLRAQLDPPDAPQQDPPDAPQQEE
jgi:deoxyribonuclease-4